MGAFLLTCSQEGAAKEATLKPEAAVFPETQHLAGRADGQVAQPGGMQAPWGQHCWWRCPGKGPGEGIAGLPVCPWGFVSMSSLSEIMRRVKSRLGSLLTLRVALPSVTLFAA